MRILLRSVRRIAVSALGLGILGSALLAGCQTGDDLAGTCREECSGEIKQAVAGLESRWKDGLGHLTPEQQLDSSRKALEILTQASGNTYTYGAHWASWIGVSGTTWIVVGNGQVVERRYSGTRSDQDAPGTVPGDAFTEKGPEVGQKVFTPALPPLPLDSLYAGCAEDLKLPKQEFTLDFRLDENFILQSCRYRPVNCADDCNFGNKIDFITWGP